MSRVESQTRLSDVLKDGPGQVDLFTEFDRVKPPGSIELSSDDLNPDYSTGERFLLNGDIYAGSWEAGLPEGTGKYLWSDGCMYEGEWSKGKISGRGKISWPSGATYEGDFLSGYIHGVGTFTGVDGTTYKGSWYMNEKKGLGTKSYSNGDVYEGSWNQGVPEGVGRYLWKNGNEYVGDWKSGRMSGRGTLMWASGDKYDGQWLDGLEHGHGVYTWTDGSTYMGSWSRGLKDGKGIYIPLEFSGRRSHAYFNEEEGSTYNYLGSPMRPRSSSASDVGPWAGNISRMSSHGSSMDKCTCSYTSTTSDGSPTLLERSWSLNDSLNQSLRFDEAPDVSKAHEIGDEAFDFPDHDDFTSSIVIREYVQGVLINEIVKGSFNPYPCRSRQRHRRKNTEPVRPGEAIFKGHQSYELMLNLQLGIRYTVGKITPEPKREICAGDFGPKARIWMNFPREGSQLTPPHQSSDFKWKDYCPVVFRHLRELFQIDTADYMLSICGNSGLRELSSPGKSGSVFYVSHDERFMIKTMRKAEVKVLLSMLPKYYDHVQKYENTLITKFFGLHRIKPIGGQKVRFVVMGNMFCTQLHIHRRFDLKGSSQGRSTDKVEIDENTTLKDLDLDFVFRLEPSWQQALLRQIECDCKFLVSQHIMDYSLLLGVHFRAPQFPAIFSVGPKSDDEKSQYKDASGGLVLVAHEPEKKNNVPGSHVRGSPLKTAAAGNKEIDLLLPGTARLRIQLGVNMPARADQISPLGFGKDDSNDSYDVVLYIGIIDILQQYDMGKKLEHAYKSLQFDAFSISAVDPSLYSRRFQDFIRKIFPENWG